MATEFRPNGISTWIGSLPVTDHTQAVKLMAEYTPDIPVWIQLPSYPDEGMISQFLPGMPGLAHNGGQPFIRTDDDAFDGEMLMFFEDYMSIFDGKTELSNSRFALTRAAAPGFYEFITYLDGLTKPPKAVKGQITGPFTFSTSVKDQDGRAIFYHSALRDISVKCIAMKARWQVNQLKKYGVPVILFLDEPGLAGFGSSAFISVSKEDIENCLKEAIAAIHEEGGVAGIHVCANTDWGLVLDSSADIVSFDAYSFFDKFILYGKQLRTYIERGGILSWGIIPTDNIQWVNQETTDSLFLRMMDQIGRVEALGIKREEIVAQSLITPSCGAGTLPLHDAKRVFQMTREVSIKIRQISERI